MGIPSFCIKRPVTTVMVLLIVVILSGFAFTKVKLEMMPELNMGIAVVNARYDGASVEEMENLVTKPIEKALGTVSNLEKMVTTSTNGVTTIMLEFVENTDMEQATLKMRENIDAIRRELPAQVEPKVVQIDPNVSETMSVGITSDTMDLEQLRSVLDNGLINQFERIEGVGAVSDVGGKTKEISIELLPDKLLNYGINPTIVTTAIQNENLNTPGGSLIQGDNELQVRTTGEFLSLEDIENLLINTPNGNTIFLREVANVKETYKKTTSYALVNGKEGIVIGITKQSSANAVQVAKNVYTELENIKSQNPEILFYVLSDGTVTINAMLNNVWVTIGQAILLAFFVLLVFLGNFRTSFIIAIAIPISILAALGMLYFNNMTLNMITLNGILISVGMLVDNSIVVLENITRYIDEGMEPKEAAAIGAQEVSMSVVASTLTTVIVFVPVFFVTGIAGVMFGNIGFVITFSLISSLLVSLTFVPMACSKFLKKKSDQVKKEFFIKAIFKKLWYGWNKAFEGLTNFYSAMIRLALRFRKTTLLLFTIIVVSFSYVLLLIGTEMTPNMDQGYGRILVKTPVGSRLNELSDVTNIVLDKIKDNKVIEEFSVIVGSESSNSNESTIILKLVPMKDRIGVDQVCEDVRVQIGEVVGAKVAVSPYQPGGSSMKSGNNVSLSIYGPDSDMLGQISNDVLDKLETIPKLRNITSSNESGYPQAQVTINKNKASYFGMSTFNIATSVQMAINGKTVTTYKVDGNELDVVVRYDPKNLNYINDLENLMLLSNSGKAVPLSEVATIVNEQSPSAITKENYKQYVSVSADFVNSNLSEVSNEITNVLKDYSMPTGYYYEFTGVLSSMGSSFRDLGIALGLGVLLVYMVIASQFESIAYPSTIMFSIPVAFSAGIFGLYVLGGKLGVIAMLGMILLMGIVVNNGIILIDYITIRRNDGIPTIEAIVDAGKTRIRPILMTTLTTVLGILPMLFATGEGNEVQKALGSVILFGLSFSTLITLILIPVLYLMLHNIRKKISRKSNIKANLSI